MVRLTQECSLKKAALGKGSLLDALKVGFREVNSRGDAVVVLRVCFPNIPDILGMYGCW